MWFGITKINRQSGIAATGPYVNWASILDAKPKPKQNTMGKFSLV